MKRCANKIIKGNVCVIIIPVYKEELDVYELISLRQVLSVLYNYDICFVTYKGLSLANYEGLLNQYNVTYYVEYFEEVFFDGVYAYNKLMKDISFYERFLSYQYMLIYQLDAFVFKDELLYWCSLDYDYIGAPWFDMFGEKTEHNTLWAVGNGGFSLRKISYFIKVLSWRFPVKKYKIDNIFELKEWRRVAYMLGRKNNMRYFLKAEDKMNEDVFFTIFLADSYIPPRLPSVDIAMRFAFEKSPSFLFELNHQRLPFGCHAFQKYEYHTFWEKYIEDETLNYNH